MDSEKKSNALVKKRKMDVSVPQAPPPKRIARPNTVLDEETYLDGLSHIIARDYFPGLLENEAKQELLDALDSKDDAWISSAHAKLHNVVSNGSSRLRATTLQQTPRNFVGDTPVAAKSDAKPEKPVNLNLSLGAFQAKYTSEDNESFNALLDKQNARNREKHAYHWNGNQLPSSRLIAYREQQAEIQESASKELVLVDSDNRPALLKHNPSTPQNSLMFPPDSVEDSYITVAQAAEAKSNAPPKSISAKNTRFEDNQVQERVQQSPSLSAINEAVSGNPRYSLSEAPFETPRVAGYAFVDAEPTKEEIRAATETVDASTILSSLTKGASEAAGSPFSIKEAGKREQLHQKLVDKSKAKGRVAELSASVFGKTPTPKFKSAPVKGSLTPAGEVLLGKFKGNEDTSNTSITNFDLTPTAKRSKRELLPGLTPKR